MKQTESFGQQTKRSKNAADIKRKKAAKSSKYKSVKKRQKAANKKEQQISLLLSLFVWVF